MKEDREYLFEFSVVMAVYNAALFLEETVNSLIVQDFGFKNIQLILVDDGSTDSSGAICDNYAANYPGNVVVIHKENGGVSSARNEGLNYIQGRYVNFLDADDKLGTKTMTAVFKFFEAHKDETDVVSIPLMFFDGHHGSHILNYKFQKGSRVIDLYKEPSMIQMSMSSAFLKHDMISNMRLDERLSFAEDAKYVTRILLKKGTLGVVKRAGAQYWYRKRSVGERSALQTSAHKPNYYLPTLRFFHKDTIQYCLNTLGYIPKFIQFTLAYDLQWRFKQTAFIEGVLSPEEEIQYRTELLQVVKNIDDDMILAQKSITQEYKVYMLQNKYSSPPALCPRKDDLLLNFQNTVATSLSWCQCLLEFLSINENSCHLEGKLCFLVIPLQHMEICFEVNGELYPCSVSQRSAQKCVLGEPILSYYGFNGKIPLKRKSEVYRVRVAVLADGNCIISKNIKYGKFFPVSDEYKNSYYLKDTWKISAGKNQLRISNCGPKEFLKSEIKFCKELWKKNKKGARKAVFARLVFHLLKRFKHKQMWLISDRIMKADDNGEVLFKYLMKRSQKKEKVYFAISSKSPDYARMKRCGPVISFLSWGHKILYLLSDCIISSQAEDYTICPFQGFSGPYKDIIQPKKFVFLQHGITKDDLSAWLNRYNKNIAIFITATVPEYRSIILGNYHYSEKEVKLTGFPRYDQLYREEKRCITIMPSWRAYLVGGIDPKTGVRRVKPSFKDSQYYMMYQSLLSQERLFQQANRLGYTIQVMVHPNMEETLKEFQFHAQAVLLPMEKPYREIFAESSLIVTDYSSVAFDFAYLKKPVIYYQTDWEEFFSGLHSYKKGYYEYERDGFGEVEYELEGIVDRIIEYMENDCQLKEKYRERIEKAFPFSDKNNCQRVYEAILSLGHRCPGDEKAWLEQK